MTERYRPKVIGHKKFSAPGDRIGLWMIALQIGLFLLFWGMQLI